MQTKHAAGAFILLLLVNALTFASASSPLKPVTQTGPLYLDTRCDNDDCAFVQIDNTGCLSSSNVLDTAAAPSAACNPLYWGDKKVPLSGLIADADVAAGAGIQWSKVSKTGSSVADLATRSAGDLS